MSRRSRNTRAWRYVWGGIRRDADARALVLASEMEEWNYDRLEVRTQELVRRRSKQRDLTKRQQLSHQEAVPHFNSTKLPIFFKIASLIADTQA